MPAVERPGAGCAPSLPGDVWGMIARATLCGEGNDVRIWERLCRVNRVWRAGLRGVPVKVTFTAPLTSEQVGQLLTTALPLRSLTFNTLDAATCIVLQQGVLRTSCETLEELHNLSGPSDGRLWADCTLSLTRFSALRSLTLCESMPPSACLLQRLPTSLQRLTITTAGPEKQILRPADGHPDLSPVWSLAHLTLLTELTLSGTDSFPSWAELLRSPAEPVLPVSLVTLRQQSRDTVFFSSENRRVPLAEVTLPMLEVHGDDVRLYYVEARAPGRQPWGAIRIPADLPLGFRTLSLHTRDICLGGEDHPGSAAVTEVDYAAELCQFLAAAPECYEEFRLYAGAAWPSLELSLAWLEQPGADMQVCSCYFDSLHALAAVMQRVAHGYDLTVSMSDDQTHVRLCRAPRPILSTEEESSESENGTGSVDK